MIAAGEGSAAERPARSFGRYDVLREIGRGGMARVYEAVNHDLGKRVAIKVLHPALAESPTAAARFLNEARAAARIRHPNVVNLFDVGSEAGVPYLVMELLDGVPLTRYIRASGSLSVEESIDLILPVISGVAAAHALGIIHRDLKTDNVMLCRRRAGELCPTVLDFGISKQLGDTDGDSDLALTKSGIVLGTIPYLAPEQTRGGKFASTKSDQYAVAVMLYECLTGARPFGGDGVYELMHAIVTAPLAPPSARVGGIPRELDAVVLRALQRDPAERYPSMAAFGAALLAFGSERTQDAWLAEFESESPATTDDRDGDLPAPGRALPAVPSSAPLEAPPAKLGYRWLAILAATLALIGVVRGVRASSSEQRDELARAPRLSSATAPAPLPAAAASEAPAASLVPGSLPDRPPAAPSVEAPAPKASASPAPARTATRIAAPRPRATPEPATSTTNAAPSWSGTEGFGSRK